MIICWFLEVWVPMWFVRFWGKWFEDVWGTLPEIIESKKGRTSKTIRMQTVVLYAFMTCVYLIHLYMTYTVYKASYTHCFCTSTSSLSTYIITYFRVGDSHCDQPARRFPQHLGDDLEEFLGIHWWGGEETGDFLQHRDPPTFAGELLVLWRLTLMHMEVDYFQ